VAAIAAIKVTDAFEDAVNALMQSSDIRQQFAAVVCSTGTLGVFGHPAHSAHGNKGEPKEGIIAARGDWLPLRGDCMRGRSVRVLKTGDGAGPRCQKATNAAIRVRRVAVCAGGSFTVGNTDGINAKYWATSLSCGRLGYAWRPRFLPRPKPGGLQPGGSDECSLTRRVSLRYGTLRDR
jgi:hypothetical protein